LTAATWDLANDSVLCTFGPTEDNVLIELVRVKTKPKSQYLLNTQYLWLLLTYFQRMYSSHILGCAMSKSRA
jgi:hypothetical protein